MTMPYAPPKTKNTKDKIRNYSTERNMDIAILQAQVNVDEKYQTWLTEFLGNRVNPLPPHNPHPAVQLPAPQPPAKQLPQGAPPTAPNVGGY